jgi:hypothetical protein
LLAVLTVAGGVLGQAHMQTLLELQTAPQDTIDAQNVRIWLPVERQNRCLLKIEIVNDSDRVIRHLVSRMMTQGYYNYYWNKRDDSGKLVDSGVYTYRVTDCGQRREGKLTVQYREWERKVVAEIEKQRSGELLRLNLLDDSARVTIEMFDYHWQPVDVPMKDSLMNAGKYRFEWQPADTVLAGRYHLRLTVNDYTHDLKLTYRKKR